MFHNRLRLAPSSRLIRILSLAAAAQLNFRATTRDNVVIGKRVTNVQLEVPGTKGDDSTA